jgi:RHS repeat-associated protein
MTDAAGTVISNCTFNAFGEQTSCSPDNASNHYRYAGKERDTESGPDDFGARYYRSSSESKHTEAQMIGAIKQLEAGHPAEC